VSYQITKAAVIGSGVMGSAIAAHLANIGIPCYLLDIVPTALTGEEHAKGLTLASPAVRNRLATQNLNRMLKEKPAPFYSKKNAHLITVGNLTDDMAKLAEADWIIEVVVENLSIKQDLFKKVAELRKPKAIVSSNTSGISIDQMVENLPVDFQEHFLGTHFFNPPRYMNLLEIIPGEKTLPAVIEFIKRFGEEELGKGVVFAKDTPNFIANRIGVFGMTACLRLMLDMNLTISEVDAITGPALGRPKSASFRTMDMVGLDTFIHVANNVKNNISDLQEKESFNLPDFVHKMVEKKWLGDKTKQGFYQKQKMNGQSKIQALNYNTLEYREESTPDYASLTASIAAGGFKNQLKILLSSHDKAGEFAWKNIKQVLLYSAQKLGEIADNVVAIDQAMRWGFNWKMGPFELWDAIDLEKSIARMKSEGESIPSLLEEMIASGSKSFYKLVAGRQHYFDIQAKEYRLVEGSPKLINLKLLKNTEKVVLENSGARLIDLGDEVFCLEFDSTNNAIGADILTMITSSVEYVVNKGTGLVIGNQGKNFCVGANLMAIFMEAQDEEWDEIELMVRMFQKAMLTIKYCPKPVVAAPFNMALGGGCEVVMHSHRARAAAETYMGLVELGVGLIPAGGGTKESTVRAAELADREKVELQPLINKAFERIAMATVSTSGQEAKELGLLRPWDKITVNSDFLIHDAKATVLAMAQEGFKPEKPKPVRVVGKPGLALLKLATYTMREGGYISEFDQYLANKLAYVITGGDLPANTYVTEEYLLDLEREVFLTLCGDRRTQARIQHMLTKGKPLRN
jgi:3-hydroxyacyl-CoA dehydrogenase